MIAPQTGQGMYDAYRGAGETPIFPIVGSDGGYSSLAGQLSKGGYIGQTFLIHPDKSFEGDYQSGGDYLVGHFLEKAGDAPMNYDLVVNKGEGSGSYSEGSVVPVTANAPPEGYRFSSWSGDTEYLAAKNSASTNLTMPGKSVAITATYEIVITDSYRLTVIDGSGSGDYEEGKRITITADDAPQGYLFVGWKGDISYMSDWEASTAEVIMPAEDIQIEASYTEIEIDTANPSANLLEWSHWSSSVDEYGSALDTGTVLNDGERVTSTFTITGSDSVKSEWAWGTVTASLPDAADNNLREVTHIKVIYSASNSFFLTLPDEGSSDDGDGFRVALPKTSGDTVLFAMEQFQRPGWSSKKEPLSLSDVKDICFETALPYNGGESEITVTEVILYNYQGSSVGVKQRDMRRGRDCTLIITPYGLSLKSNVPDNVVIELYSLQGRLLFSKGEMKLLSGENGVILPPHLASGLYLISVKGGTVNLNQTVVIP